MGLFDIFSSEGPRQSLEQSRQSLTGTMGRIGDIYGQAQTGGLGALQSGQTNALGAIIPGYTSAIGAINTATPQALDFLREFTGEGVNVLRAGQEPALGALRSGVLEASSAYDPLAGAATGFLQRGNAGADLYADALGLNGQAGIDRARAAFRTSPGYDFALNQGLEGISRAAAAGGMAAGGNVLRGAGEYATNAANQEWQKYLSNVFGIPQLYAPLSLQGLGTAAQGRANAALTGGTGAANIYTGTAGRIADLLGTAAGRGAGIYTGAGTSLADLYSGGGRAAGAVYTGTGTNIADLLGRTAAGQAGAIGTLGGQIAGTYPQEAQADLAASNNLWNLIAGGTKLAAGGGFLPGGSYTPWKF